MAGVPSKLNQDEDTSAPDIYPQDVKKQLLVNAAMVHCFQSMCQHMLLVQSEPMLVKQIYGDDAATAAQMLANTSSLSALIAIVFNQFGGKLSDSFGRKKFLMVGPLTNAILGMLVYSNSDSRAIVLGCRVLRLIVTTFSNTVMVWSSFADVMNGPEFKVAGVKLSMVFGAGVVLTPFLEAAMLHRTNDPRFSYLFLTLGAAIQAVLSGITFPEMLEPSKRRQFRFADLFPALNPFGFLNIYRRGSRSLSGIATITSLQLLLDGKNMSDLLEMWKRDHLKWTLHGSRNFISFYGLACLGSSALLSEKLLKSLNNRQYTSLTNILLALAFLLRGSSNSLVFLSSTLPLLPGVNGASTKALLARAVVLAKQEGFGMGEFTAWVSNLRSFVNVIQPMIIGSYYAWCLRKNVFPGTVFWVAGFLGAVLPELLTWCLSDAAIEDTKQIKEGKSKQL